ncbi:hypothetical protein GCM10022224_090660 [Nonomuraea antimicrobica]|uniref:Uncharacterized protein n=1 Tax=Nonomuraea antimicrobica TaxID=561173 RepID=A0ABP7DXP6_9ACTN
MEPIAEPVLPYPHARNDCILCREMDVDFEIVEEALEPSSWTPGRPPRRFCQGCIGRWMVTQAAYGRGSQTSPDEPLKVTVTMLAPGGGSW